MHEGEGEINVNFEKHYLFEDCVAKIFAEAEFGVTKHYEIENNGKEIDIVVEKNEIKYGVEVKYSPIKDNAVWQIYSVAKECNMEPILVTVYELEEKKRHYYEATYPGLILLDISNLLFAVHSHTELQNELMRIVPYSVNDIEPKEGFVQINCIRHDDYTRTLIREVELCESGRGFSTTYEKICHKLLKNIFSGELDLWKEQQKANNNLYRFDLLCRIKDKNEKTFWSIIERYFNTKYVIFEFKNYSEKITQKEVYTTEKYLYSKALRSVGIVIAANGYDENAYWAAKGCLRENGKLIMLLETQDLIAMNKMKLDHEDPSDYLLEKLDGILLELEK